MARDRDAALAERDALRVELAQEKFMRARMAEAIGDVISAHGCDCDCGCDSTGHFDDCDTCFACQVEEVLEDARSLAGAEGGE